MPEGAGGKVRSMRGSPCAAIHALAQWWIYGRMDIDQLTANIDLLPTLIDLCQLEVSQADFGAGSFHGMSLAPLSQGRNGDIA